MSPTLMDEDEVWQRGAEDVAVEIRPPKRAYHIEDSLDFHAARLLLLMFHAGGRLKRIEGRTKLAKMDFLVRYPTYLVESARIKGYETDVRAVGRPESRMIRYKYGPWDAKYYNVFAYMVAKGLVRIENAGKGDSFELTDRGKIAVEELGGPEFDEIVKRCRSVYVLFGKSTGTAIKEFIYRYFTEIIDKPLGAQIDGVRP